MAFLHESLHTKFGASFFNSSEDQKNKIGGRFKDPFQGSKRPGNVVSRINRFREQLGLATRERYFTEYDNKVNPTLLFKKDGNEYIIQSRNIKLKK